MPKVKWPRKGSLQFWHRARSKRTFARVRTWPQVNDNKPLGFAGYKVGMTHIIANDNKKSSTTKGMEIFYPVTIIECPPLKTASIRFYKNTNYGLNAVSQIFADNLDKELERTIIFENKEKKKSEKNIPDDFDIVRLIVYTQPKLTGIGKKKPEIFEIGVGGNKEEQLNYAKNKLGKEITVDEVFKEGQQLDVHSVTKAKGVQGPVKRFGVSLKQHKSEKGVRRVGTMGSWNSQGHIMWRVAKAGKMGYHMRTEYNKWLLKIGKANEIINKSGFHNYGNVKNTFVMLKGSVMGGKKRLIRMNYPMRPNRKVPESAPAIVYNSLMAGN